MTQDFSSTPLSSLTDEQRRQRAIQRIKARYDFKVHLVVFVVVNAALIAMWYATSRSADGALGFFWPIFPLLGWGIGLALHGYTTYFPPAVTEEQIQREMGRLR